MTLRTVAALYIDPRGPYPAMPDVECWDAARDARLYDGPHPVVAHPPCQLWGAFAAINYKRWGGEHNRPGNDRGCFASALANVRRCGGVLEHPAFSRAWDAHGLPRPPETGWGATTAGEYVCEVWQCTYGHKARKRTWLFYAGRHAPAELDWLRPATYTHQIGHDSRLRVNRPTLRGREASATPPAFAEALVALARASVAPQRADV